jgi:hypothetical protein
MTTSVIDLENLKKHLPADVAAEVWSWSSAPSKDVDTHKPVSGAELVRRVAGLFTPEEAEALGRRIEESCEQIDD